MSRFLHCGLAVVDDIAVHLPVVLVDFMGTLERAVCKYMKEWNWKSKNKPFIDSARVDRHSETMFIASP
jgi:hypothetical protein